MELWFVKESDGVAVDVYIIVGYGTKISAICKRTRTSEKYNRNNVRICCKPVNVYVQGVKIIEAVMLVDSSQGGNQNNMATENNYGSRFPRNGGNPVKYGLSENAEFVTH